MKVDVEGDKYTFIIRDTGEVALCRYGENPIELGIGAKALIALIHEVSELREALAVFDGLGEADLVPDDFEAAFGSAMAKVREIRHD